MVSAAVLERPGMWRTVGLTALLIVTLLPALPLLFQGGASLNLALSADRAFLAAFQNSALVALATAAISFTVGLPFGVLISLYEFPGRRTLVPLAALPLLVPSFLSAIGWFSLTTRLGGGAEEMATGFGGCVLVFSLAMIPLVLLATHAATLSLSNSQVDAARLAGGERTLFRLACGHAATPALLAAALGAVLTLSDPGPGQILGLPTAAAEILTSFSALYDFTHAGRQCIALGALILVPALPLAWLAAPRLASQLLARQTASLRRIRHARISSVAPTALFLLVLVGTVAPFLGLCLPLLEPASFSATTAPLHEDYAFAMNTNYAFSVFLRTAANTVIYAAGAGILAAALALIVAVLVGRREQLRTLGIGFSLALFSLPPALAALGLIQLAATAPPWADALLRSRFTVCAALGLRFLPVAVLLALRAWGATSPSWALAAGLHGVSFGTYARRVAIPLLRPALALAALIVALLATADITTVLLLSPPGEASLPQAIFTVMANAPEALVATLCLIYLTAASVVLGTLSLLLARGDAA